MEENLRLFFFFLQKFYRNQIFFSFCRKISVLKIIPRYNFSRSFEFEFVGWFSRAKKINNHPTTKGRTRQRKLSFINRGNNGFVISKVERSRSLIEASSSSAREWTIIIHREVYASVTRRVMAARDKSGGSRGTAVSRVPGLGTREPTLDFCCSARLTVRERKPAANDNFACAIGINSLTIAQLFSLPVGSLHAFCGCLVNLSTFYCSLSSCLCTSDIDSM